jgi:hypothetical protein
MPGVRAAAVSTLISASHRRGACLGGVTASDDLYPYMDAPTLTRLSLIARLLGLDCTRTFGLLLRPDVAAMMGSVGRLPTAERALEVQRERRVLPSAV